MLPMGIPFYVKPVSRTEQAIGIIKLSFVEDMKAVRSFLILKGIDFAIESVRRYLDILNSVTCTINYSYDELYGIKETIIDELKKRNIDDTVLKVYYKYVDLKLCDQIDLIKKDYYVDALFGFPCRDKIRRIVNTLKYKKIGIYGIGGDAEKLAIKMFEAIDCDCVSLLLIDKNKMALHNKRFISVNSKFYGLKVLEPQFVHELDLVIVCALVDKKIIERLFADKCSKVIHLMEIINA